MGNTVAIARRELNGFFNSAIAYVVLCVFTLLAGLLFMLAVFDSPVPVKEASMRPLFRYLIWVLIAIAPAISMRLLAEEMRSGTIEPLMTSPVGDAQVILGKWLGALGFFAVLLCPTLLYAAILALWGSPDIGPLFTGYLGLMLVGGLYLAIGVLASVATRNQIIAFLVTVFVILMLTLVPYFMTLAVDRMGDQPMLAGALARNVAIGVAVAASALAGILLYSITRSPAVGLTGGIVTAVIAGSLIALLAIIEPAGWSRIIAYVNVNEQFNDFNNGVLTSRNFVFFLSAIVLFLTLAVKVLESRKWR